LRDKLTTRGIFCRQARVARRAAWILANRFFAFTLPPISARMNHLELPGTQE
jgi:hypothetical protein